MDYEQYRYSGKYSIAGLLLACVLSCIVALFAAYLYNVLIAVIPFVYINFFFTVGFGAVLGYTVKFACRFSRIRNSMVMLYVAGGTAVVANYFQWVACFSYLSGDTLSFDNYLSWLDLILYPVTFLDFLKQVNQYGFWQIGGITFTDVALTIIWIIEFFTIAAACLFIVYKHPIVPYSETLEKLYPKYRINYQFSSIGAKNLFIENLQAAPVAAIAALGYGTATRYSEVYIYFLEREEVQYVSVSNISVPGKGREKTTPVIELLKITTVQAREIMDKFGSKKLFILDY